MASSIGIIIAFVTLAINLLIVNAAPISEGISSLSSEARFRPLGVIIFAPELADSQGSLFPSKQLDSPTHHRSERMARSILEDQEQPQDDDLETAAGTNLLRPLFVYRQQMAYRERIRKAARRAAPDYY